MVRTFRLGPAGELYPVNSIDAWVEGWNTARCGRGKTHAPPGPHCRFGFYLYIDAAYALRQPPTRQVMAVVATHGAMGIRNRGARASRARVEALWLGPRVSDRLAQAVSERYPTMMVCRDRTTMELTRRFRSDRWRNRQGRSDQATTSSANSAGPRDRQGLGAPPRARPHRGCQGASFRE